MAGMGEAQLLLRELYDIHDFYFAPDKLEKKAMLQQLIDRITALVDTVDEADGLEARATALYIRGRALDALEEFDPQAEICLCRSVKMAPENVDGWNALGHCYWKKGDLTEAANCFRESLNQSRNIKALQQLSMLLRVTSVPAAERASNVSQSIDLAKEAIAMDVDDATSWYVLGNAHLTRFFGVSLDVSDLHRALKAYNFSEHKGGNNNPDLYFNKGNVLRYLQDYILAVSSFRQAHAIDPNLPAMTEVMDITQWLQRLNTLVQKKGRVKARRIDQLAASLQEWAKQSHSNTPTEAVHTLTPGQHDGVRVCGKALLTCTKGNIPPECFLFLDSGGSVCVLSVYNISSQSCASIADKDFLSIDDPLIHDVVSSDETIGTLRFIRVLHLEKFRVNGSPISRAAVAAATLEVKTFDT